MTISASEKESWRSLHAQGFTAPEIARIRGACSITVWKTVGRQSISCVPHHKNPKEQPKKKPQLPVAQSHFVRPLSKEELMGGGRPIIRRITFESL